MNLQRRPNAADRLAALPLVASARTKLSVVYSGTKYSHPSLRCVCEGLERCVTAVISPVVDKLQPHGEYWHTRLDVAFKSLYFVTLIKVLLKYLDHSPGWGVVG